ncbi:hypothetical protein WOSG25_061210 [Weissella oryzae SG25]|uniref:Uncharacterized protein n=1 Tax=Weissella oryzae (strain DSM 25784 / JCM 18191 / LMG 30913 / SG25) TaxID=1329250 RepID=A0A069D0W9_WEIOS|nr:hypothetical protein [Weissella oryzae]GAK30991.1 hypothetical protein WOSG25_061210 [Weissella oryzae SG25]
MADGEKKSVGRPRKYTDGTTNAQNEANKRYREKNRERTRRTNYKSHGKTFISEYATVEELAEIIEQAEKRLDDLNEK